MTDTEMTRFLAEKCMGWKEESWLLGSVAPTWEGTVFRISPGRKFRITAVDESFWFDPVSSISDAFRVVEKMRDFNLAVDIRGPVKHHADWSIEFFPWDGSGKVFHGHSDTCARAICLAAIAALEGK